MEGAEALRRIRRAARIRAAVVVASLIIFDALIILDASRRGLDTETLSIFAGIIAATAATVAIASVGPWQKKRLVAYLNTIAPRVTGAGLLWFRGYVLLLDNGFGLQLSGQFISFWSFRSAGGEVLRPTIEEFSRWSRPFRWSRVAMIRPQSPSGLAPKLAALKDRFGTRLAYAAVYASRTAPTDPRGAAWGYMVAFATLLRLPDRAPLIGSLDQVAEFVALLRATYAASGTS